MSSFASKASNSFVKTVPIRFKEISDTCKMLGDLTWAFNTSSSDSLSKPLTLRRSSSNKDIHGWSSLRLSSEIAFNNKSGEGWSWDLTRRSCDKLLVAPHRLLRVEVDFRPNHSSVGDKFQMGWGEDSEGCSMRPTYQQFKCLLMALLDTFSLFTSRTTELYGQSCLELKVAVS